jgi:hypothetical protein
VAKAGKGAHALPLYTNVALNRPGKRPGEYPSGGLLPHLIDVWKVAAPSLDFLAPDIYFPNLSEWVRHYARSDNALFIPEANHARLPQAGASAFFAIGEYGALGVSPFSIDTLPEERGAADASVQRARAARADAAREPRPGPRARVRSRRLLRGQGRRLAADDPPRRLPVRGQLRRSLDPAGAGFPVDS